MALALGAAALVVSVRLFRLGSLQTDLYGDIELVHRYVARVRGGAWPFDFQLSAGPLYHYLVAPIVAAAGGGYLAFKIASVVVSLAALAATYALARRLVDDRFALLATAIAGTSSWLLVFSRLGNSQILIPVLTTSASWLALRVADGGGRRDVVACAAVSALGLYVYPQTFVLPGVVFATLLCLRWTGQRVPASALALFAGVALLGALPFAWIAAQDPLSFVHGHIGSKLVTDGGRLRRFAGNLLRAALAFHVRGDSIFRSNPRGLPHLDALSGVLFGIGVAFWLGRERRARSPALLVPFVLLQLPSVLVLAQPREVPSASRTLGVAPTAYLLVASGAWWLAQAAPRRGRWPRRGIAAALLAAVVALNLQRYFRAYIGGLPYHDTSIGAEIAAYADRLPPGTRVYIAGNRWESDMPETPFVKLVAARGGAISELAAQDLTCERLRRLPQPAALIWSFREALPAAALEGCRDWLPARLHRSARGWPVFHAAPLQSPAP